MKRDRVSPLLCVALVLSSSAGCRTQTQTPTTGEASSALSSAQCSFFADSKGKVQICHATGSENDPYVSIDVSVSGCINGLAGHPHDYIDVNGAGCDAQACLPSGAPCDATLPCCEGLSCINGGCVSNNLSSVTMVSAGTAFALALESDGTVLAWGDNTNGQLGNGTTDPSLLPTQVLGLGSGSGVIAVSAGYGHALALKSDGTVLGWGVNALGQVGDGSTTQRNTPVQVLGPGSGVTAISAGFSHSLALKSDGTVLCWGRNSLGACGQNNTTSPELAPVTVTGSATGVTAIAAGTNSSYAIRSDGSLWAWGNNNSGQLGDGSTTQRNVPVPVSGLSTGVSAVSTSPVSGSQFALALKSDGTVLGWGNNSFGQLGDGSTTQRTTPVQVSGLGSGSGVTKIAAAGGATNQHGLALKSNGTVMAWGANGLGQLGDGTTTQRLTPVQVSGLGSGSGVTAVVSGDAQSYARMSDTTVLSWGSNSSGQLGHDDFAGKSSPTEVSGFGSGSGVTAVAAGNGFALALKSDGTVWAWGDNSSGELGDGTTTQRSTPVQVPGATGVIAIAASVGSNDSYALKSDGTLLAWGDNTKGQLGSGSTTSSSTPVQVSGAAGITAIAAGISFALALTSDGTVLGWGAGGKTGDNTSTQRNAPVQATDIGGNGTLSGVTAIAATGGPAAAAFALKSDGTVLAWGANDVNQLGDGTTTTELAPVQVSGLGPGSGMVGIAAYKVGGFAYRSDGSVVGWGGNSAGQLGDGTTTVAPTPVQVGGYSSGSNVSKVTGGNSNTLVLLSDGTVQSFGANSSGQLGDGTVTQRLSPVQVSGLGSGSTVTAISAGANFSMALKSDGTVLAWGADGSAQLGDGADFTSNYTPSNVLVRVPATSADGGSTGLSND
jgi:alpha-tubulin suppressor-like RCC1 family protein